MTYKVTEKRGANHGLHLVLSLLTCGVWAVTGWPVAAVLGRRTVTRHDTAEQVIAAHPEVPWGQLQPPPGLQVPVVSLSGTHYLNPRTNEWERFR